MSTGADRTPSRPDEAGVRRLIDAARLAPPGVGESIGPYQLVEEIGRGGHSAVFRALQSAPVRRELAVKVLADPAPSANVAARFARERMVVARLRHPGIVPLVDAGEVGPPGAAVPWFAMPLVDGESADRWCEKHRATRTVRLRVVELAARAVAAAHALGVVHRDLKPGNILVSGAPADPQVHVIDFGVAKLLDPEFDTGDTLATRVGGIVGTPEFMSPEQANLDAASIGPASDVYALGLVACVLLGGAIPGGSLGPDRAARPMGERLRAAAERMVPRISELAGDRSLRGEVDWIVAKACARAIDARYPNAGALADDLARLREGQPIVAAPKDSGYAGLFALRKYRLPIAGAAVAIVSVVVALAAIASKERERAEFERGRNERLSKLLSTARTELIPLTGRTRGDVVDESKAIPLLEMMYAINIELLEPDAEEIQRSELALARGLDRAHRYPEAETLYRRLLDRTLASESREGDRAYIRFLLGGCVYRASRSRVAEARELMDAAVAYWKSDGGKPFQMCNAILEQAAIAGIEGRIEEQKALLEEGIACTIEKTGEGSHRRREAWSFMGDYLRANGTFDEARVWYRRALEGNEATQDPMHLVWRDAWQGELLWMDRTEASRRGEVLDSAREAEFQAIVARVQSRDPGNPRLERWKGP